MRHNINLFIIAFFYSVLLFSQENKKYINYKVKKGETVRSIAKDNKLKIKDILLLNPEISKHPDPNTIIIIPNKNYTSDIRSKSNTTFNDDNQNNFENYHIVLPKETLFSISQKYRVTMDQLKHWNQINGDSISIGQKLKIRDNLTSQTKAIKDIVEPNYLIHEVLKGDTLYNISKKYGISLDDLIKLNPELEMGLKTGMFIKIYNIEDGFDLEFSKDALELAMNIDVHSVAVELYKDTIATNDTIYATLLLPLKLNQLTSDSVRIKQFEKSTSLLNLSTDFYMGAEIAIDSLRKQGLKTILYVYDTQKDQEQINLIKSIPQVKRSDVVIGPLYIDNAKYISNFLASTPVIAPLYQENQSSVYERTLIKGAPDNNQLELKVLNYMIRNYNDQNIVLVGDDTDESNFKIEQVLDYFQKLDSIITIEILKPEDGYINGDRIKSTLKYEVENWVLLLSEDVVTTFDTVLNLGVIPLKTAVEDNLFLPEDIGYDIRLFSLAKKKNFNNSDNNYLARLNFTYPRAEFVNYQNDRVKEFSSKYELKNGAYPSIYAFKGFDVTYDTLMRLASGESLFKTIKRGSSQRLAHRFEYLKDIEGGYDNTGVYLLKYTPDLHIKIIE